MALELEKPTPIECLEQGYPMTMARQMDPEDLTREDCVKLLEGGFEQYVIRMRYNFSGEAWLAKMKEWGLNRKATNWDFRSERNQRAPAQEKQESVAVEPPAQEEPPVVPEPPVEEQKPTAIEWLKLYGDAPSHLGQIRILTYKDLTREDAQKLLAAGVSKCMLWKMYGIATPSGSHYKLLKEMLQEPVQEDEPPAEEPKTLTPDDLTKEIAEQLLAEGVSKTEIRKRYGMTYPVQLTTRLTRWGLGEKKASNSPWNKRQVEAESEPVKAAESGAEARKDIQWYEDQRKTVLTEEEKQDLFAEPDQDGRIDDLVGGRAIDAPEPIYFTTAEEDYATRKRLDDYIQSMALKVETAEAPTPPPSDPLADLDFEECEPKLQHAGELWIRVTVKKSGHAGGSIAFSSAAWGSFTGRSFSVEVSRQGDVVRLTENSGGKFKARGTTRHVAAGNLTEKLRERGVELPARFGIERQGEVWVGRLGS